MSMYTTVSFWTRVMLYLIPKVKVLPDGLYSGCIFYVPVILHGGFRGPTPARLWFLIA